MKHGLYRRSFHRGCARDAQQKTAARAAVPAVRSLLPGSLLPTMALYYPPVAHDCSLLLTKKMLPGASLHAPSVILGRPRNERHWLRLPSHFGLVPLRGTPNEPMSGKGNFLYCIDMFFCSVSSRHESVVAVPAELGAMMPTDLICYDRCR